MRLHIFSLSVLCCVAACGKANSNIAAVSSPYVATAVGRIDSAQEARQLVALVDGAIENIYVSRGALVRKGQPLAHINCAPDNMAVKASAAKIAQSAAAARRVEEGARVEEIDAALAAAESMAVSERDAQDKLRRISALEQKGFVTKRDIEAGRNAVAIAGSELARASAQLRMLQNGSRPSEIFEAQAATQYANAEYKTALARADQCTLRSPIDGTVLQILRQEGEFSGASQGTPLLVVGDLSQLIVRAEINERDAVLVGVGQKASIWLDGQKNKWTGRVTSLAAVMGRRSARSLDPTDRYDRDVREVFIELKGEQPPSLVGLRVTIGLHK